MAKKTQQIEAREKKTDKSCTGGQLLKRQVVYEETKQEGLYYNTVSAAYTQKERKCSNVE